MQGGDRLVFTAMIALSAILAVAAGVNAYQRRQSEHVSLLGQTLHASAKQVIGPQADFQGDPHSSYTLVEFGDYQCPPCRAASQQIPELLRRYHGRLRFTFRNLPLTTIHPYAMQAALVAEAAREQRKFWPAHDLLFRIPLDADFTSEAMRVVGLDKNRLQKSESGDARQAVEADRRACQILGIDSTPTFLLCDSSGSVIRLTDLDQVSELVER